jgi:hypothetical protein
MARFTEEDGPRSVPLAPIHIVILVVAVAMGIGITLLSVPQAVALLAVAAVVVAVFASPYAGLFVFCVLAVLVPYATATVGRRFAVSEAILALTWMSVLWRVATGSRRLRFGKTEFAVAVLMVFSVIPFLAGEHALPDPYGRGPVIWVRWLLDVSAVLLVPAVVTDRRQAIRLAEIMVASAAIMVAVSAAMFMVMPRPDAILPFLDLAQYGDLDKVASFFTGFAGRMGSPWLHPNALGGLLALLLPLAIVPATTARGGRRGLALLAAGLLGLGLVLGGSRGATISVALVIIWLAHVRFRRGLATAVAVLAVAAVLIGVRAPLSERLATLSSSDPSTAERIQEYRAFPGYVASYPLGIGFVETISFEAEPLVGEGPRIGSSNLWLVYALHLGLPGLAIFLWVSYRWWREVGAVSADAASAYDLATKACVYTAFLTGLFDHYFGFTVVLTAMFWLVIGLSLYLARNPPPAIGDAYAPLRK